LIEEGVQTALVFALQIVTPCRVVPVPRVVKIELHLQIANDKFKIETGVIRPVTCFNRHDQPVDGLRKSPEGDIKLEAFVFSGF
jgi:hypothetical protein